MARLPYKPDLRHVGADSVPYGPDICEKGGRVWVGIPRGADCVRGGYSQGRAQEVPGRLLERVRGLLWPARGEPLTLRFWGYLSYRK